MARPGPDGAIYVVDMYRLVLEHPEWIPADISKGLNLRAGEDMGRIYRISGPSTTKSEVALLKEPVRQSVTQRSPALSKREPMAYSW